MKILVVEDDVDAAEMLSMLLRLQGHTVLIALTGQHAIALASDQAPDLAIVDLCLPDIDGLGVVRAIRAMAVRHRCVCVALTNCEEPAVRMDAEVAGVDHFLLKNEDIGNLLRLIDRLA